MLFHRTACVSSEDILVELIDYCYRKFVTLTDTCSRLGENEYIFPSVKLSVKDVEKDLEGDSDRNSKEIEWSCVIACFSIIRFISDHTESLPVPIIH